MAVVFGLGCQAAGIHANFGRSDEPSPVPSPAGVPQIQQSVSFFSIGSTEMASESYRGVSSMGFYSQGVSQDVAFLMLGPSLAVESSVSAVTEGAP